MSQERAWPLIEAGYNALELSLALEVSGQTARQYIREFQAMSGRRPAKSRSTGCIASTWTERFSLTQLWSLGMGSR